MIEVKIIADSISENGDRITTFELQYPRFIHSELMTHRLFSRNAASSRAIPIEKMIEQVENDPAMPVEWGINQPGMQAKTILEGVKKKSAIWCWERAAKLAVVSAKLLGKLGLHKQIVNRVLEPFQWMKTVVTATEFDNYWWLRCDPDAQPEIKKLAELMCQQFEDNEPVLLKAGEWHVPYYEGNYGSGVWKGSGYSRGASFEETDWKMGGYTLEEALKISASCCAQVSFRASDDSLEKAERIYDKLVTSKPVHASPMEHQATPIDYSLEPEFDIWDLAGVTHVDRENNYWSGNLKGWVQHRQLIPNNACWDYKEK